MTLSLSIMPDPAQTAKLQAMLKRWPHEIDYVLKDAINDGVKAALKVEAAGVPFRSPKAKREWVRRATDRDLLGKIRLGRIGVEAIMFPAQRIGNGMMMQAPSSIVKHVPGAFLMKMKTGHVAIMKRYNWGQRGRIIQTMGPKGGFAMHVRMESATDVVEREKLDVPIVEAAKEAFDNSLDKGIDKVLATK